MKKPHFYGLLFAIQQCQACSIPHRPYLSYFSVCICISNTCQDTYVGHETVTFPILAYALPLSLEAFIDLSLATGLLFPSCMSRLLLHFFLVHLCKDILKLLIIAYILLFFRAVTFRREMVCFSLFWIWHFQLM